MASLSDRLTSALLTVGFWHKLQMTNSYLIHRLYKMGIRAQDKDINVCGSESASVQCPIAIAIAKG